MFQGDESLAARYRGDAMSRPSTPAPPSLPPLAPLRPPVTPSPAGIRRIGALLLAPSWRRFAFIGASKNAGKTTALNAAAQALGGSPGPVGLVSMGIDGEKRDVWLDIPKPPVQVQAGTLVITGEEIVARSGGLLRTLAATGRQSSFGATVVARARAPGGVMLAGIRQRRDLVEAVALLEAHGATRVCIDGAYHRQAAAHPAVADALVVVVGAVLSERAPDIAALACVTIEALLTAPLSEPIDAAGTVVVDGALSDHLLEECGLLDGRGGNSDSATRRFVVADPSRVLLGERSLLALRRAAIRIEAHRAIPIAAIALNPHRPQGVDVSTADLATALQIELAARGLTVPPFVDVAEN